MVPASQFDIAPCDSIESVDDCRVERTHQRRMNEVKQVGHSRTQTLDLERIDLLNCLNHCLRGIAAVASIEQPGKSTLICGIFINIGYAEFWFPQKGMVSAFENLTLLGD